MTAPVEPSAEGPAVLVARRHARPAAPGRAFLIAGAVLQLVAGVLACAVSGLFVAFEIGYQVVVQRGQGHEPFDPRADFSFWLGGIAATCAIVLLAHRRWWVFGSALVSHLVLWGTLTYWFAKTDAGNLLAIVAAIGIVAPLGLLLGRGAIGPRA